MTKKDSNEQVRRSSRKRSTQNQQSPSNEEPATPTKRKKNFPEKVRNKRQNKYDPQFLLTNAKSKFALIDLKNLINMHTFNSILTDDERQDLLQLLPDVDKVHSDNNSQLQDSFFKYHVYLNESIESFQDSLFLGYLDPENVSSLENTAEKNKMKRWKDVHFEQHWGEKAKGRYDVAGKSATVTLKQMCQAKLIRVGDDLHYRRTFKAGCIEVDIIARVIDISSDGYLEVKIAKKGPTFSKIQSPSQLETQILDYSKKIAKKARPNGNAFKSIKLVRNKEDMGRLFDVRMQYYNSMQGLRTED